MHNTKFHLNTRRAFD